MHEDEESDPPDGYQCVSTFRYPVRLMFITRLLPVLLFSSLYLFASWGIIGGDIVRILASWGAVVFIGVVFMSTDIVRGLIQRGMCHLLGYRISFYTLFLALLEPTFAADPGQFQRRRDALLIAIAPLSLFILLGVPLLFNLPGVIGIILALVLIINIFGAAWDIFFIGWLLRRPRGTILYTENIQLLSVFDPVAVQSGK